MLDQDITTQGPMDAAQRTALIQQNAKKMLENATLEQLEKTLPQYVPMVKELMTQIDVTDPLSIARFGSWALEGQAEAAMEILGAVQQAPSQQAVVEVHAFENRLRERVAPLLKRYEERSKDIKNRDSIFKSLGEGLKTVGCYIRDPSGKKNNARKLALLSQEISGLEQDGTILEKIVVDTVRDTVALKTQLALHRDLPTTIQEQAAKAAEAHKLAGQKIFLSLVAVNETKRNLSEQVIPELENKAAQQSITSDDLDLLRQSKEGLGLLETRKTDLTAAAVMAALQKGMAEEMGHVNARSAIEMERLESSALPQMLTMLGNMGLQQRTTELTIITIRGNELLRNATESGAKGFAEVLRLSMEADKAMLASTQAVVEATNTTIKAVEDYRTHEAKHIERQQKAQEELRTAFGNLRVAGTRIDRTKGPKVINPSDAERTALQVTGLSLHEINAQQPPAAEPVVAPATVFQQVEQPQPTKAAQAKPASNINDMFSQIRESSGPTRSPTKQNGPTTNQFKP